jgi:hypothetical protein
LKIVGAQHLTRHVPRQRKNRRVVAICFIEAGDEMGAAGSGRPATDAEPTGELCLSRGRKRRPFLMAEADPFDFAVANSVGDRIKRVANEAEYVRDVNLFEHVDQSTGYCLSLLRIDGQL